ncbi:MAG: restriction endonuclease subunit S, partial [Cytophagaceae bacterium]
LLEGDLLISITADLGIIGVVPASFGDAFISQHIALVRLNKEVINPEFAGYFLSSQVGQIMFSLLNDGGAKAGLNLKTINKIAVIKPPLEEQNLIVLRIEKSNQFVRELDKRRAKLRSLKTGLMQDLLSGKVRVGQLLKEAVAA